MSELNSQLNSLNERVDELVNNPSELTKDAVLAQLRAFYDAVKKTEFEEVAAPVAKAVKAKTAPTPAPTPVAVVEPVIALEPAKVEEPKVALIVAKEEKPVVEEVAKEVIPEPVAEVKVVEEKPKATKEPMIGKETVAAEGGDKKILAGQFNNTPLTDLRSGIPLNEKFGIIRNLFKGNASDFGDAVLKLNNAASAKEMTHYMELLKQRFEWDDRTEAYQNFAGYVERKKLSIQPSKADADQ
ncbi:MAG: hypothetical protein K9J17_01095 [Flavobacteriales bacterium]|nr:hypothetical protein [Flavobacteriales bacterium]